MKRALIGHTGFVGSNLCRQAPFAAFYNSSNIEAIRGQRYDLIVCAGAPAVKWKANQEPAQDWHNLERLMACLQEAEAQEVVLISTVDVYPSPVAVDEDTPIDRHAGSAYGRHRLRLEDFVRQRFDTTTIRLPGLFGPGLKKNVIYDFLHGNMIDRICPDSAFQFYSLAHLWKDIEAVRGHRLPLVNFATEPITVRTVAHEAFGFGFENPGVTNAARYDMRTKYSTLLGGSGDYLQDRKRVLTDLHAFVTSQGWSRA